LRKLKEERAMVDFTFNQLLVNVIIIAVSFFFLNWASNTVITNALKVSAISKLGKTSVGFTLISLSTTLPELTVAIIAATSGGAALSVGNVLGSNIFNINGIIGLATVLLALKCFLSRKKGPIKSTNIITSLAKSDLGSIEFGLFISSIVPLILIYVTTGAAWLVGLILLVIFIGYMYKLSKVRLPEAEEVRIEEKKNLKRYIIYTIIGALGVVLSANFLVDSAIEIATSAGISQQVIGATIIAFGTSLPELTIGLKSVLKGHASLAVGNIIGASFLNTTLILGITFFLPSLLGSSVSLNMSVFQNLVIFSIITNLFFWYFLSRERITWREGAIFLFIYILFIITTVGSM
jgi:cation:H+ antiporter